MQEKNKDSLQEVLQEQKTEVADIVINRENEVAQIIDPEKKHIYKKTKKLKKCIKFMAICNEKVEMYKRAADKFEAISGFLDADELAAECRQLAKKTKKKVKKITYEKAVNIKSDAKSADDFKSAAKEFRKISGYLDADALTAECEQMYEKLENKTSMKKFVRMGAIILCLIVLLLGARTSHAKYYIANTYMYTGSYVSAAKMYNKLGPYKDCVERLAECRYQNGLKLEAAGDFINAKKSYARAGAYKDSDVKKVNMEKSIIKNSKAGDKVWIGNNKWKIIDIVDGRALLVKTKILPEMAYNTGSASVTWETAAIRKWLNSDFFYETFSEAERNNIVLSDIKNEDNAAYKTEGGNDTKDSIFLLSINDVTNYKALLPPVKSDSWLRSPGNSKNSAAFLSGNGKVMSYGYETSNNEFGVLPAFWFSIK